MAGASSINLGARLKAARLAAGYRKARHFASVLDIRENTYSRYERGESTPAYETLQHICSVLGIGAGDLLDPPSASGAPDITSREGFAEKQHAFGAMPHAAARDGPQSGGGPDDLNAAHRCSLEAWQLAERLAGLEAGGETHPGQAEATRHVAIRTGELYVVLMSQPFELLRPYLAPNSRGGSDGGESDIALRAAQYLAVFHRYLAQRGG